jgi:hypothetical protein
VLSSSACPPELSSTRRSQFDISLNQLLHRPRLSSLTVEKQWRQHPSASGDTPCGNHKPTILGVLQNQKHIRTLIQIWETQQTTHRVLCTFEIKTIVVFTFLLRHPSTTRAIPQSGQGTSGKPFSSPTGSKLME